MLIIAQVLKEFFFAHSQTTNKLVNEAAKDSARVNGQDRKIPPALGTNLIILQNLQDFARSQAWSYVPLVLSLFQADLSALRRFALTML